MTSILTKITRSPQAWSKPQFDMPHVIGAHELQPIGELRGRQWFSHKKFGELQERPKTLSSRDVLPDTVVAETEIDGERRWRSFDVAAPGTLEGLRRIPVRSPKDPAPHRGIDALALTHLGQPQPERIVAFDRPANGVYGPLSKAASPPTIKPAQPPARGAEAVIARLHKAGAGLYLSTDGAHVILTVFGGRATAGMVELFEAAQPLLLAHLRGGPLLCVVADHGKGDDPTAVTLLVGGTPACQRHATEMYVATDAKGAA